MCKKIIIVAVINPETMIYIVIEKWMLITIVTIVTKIIRVRLIKVVIITMVIKIVKILLRNGGQL